MLGGNAFSRDQAARMVERGYQLLALGFDWSLIQHGASAVLPTLPLDRQPASATMMPSGPRR